MFLALGTYDEQLKIEIIRFGHTEALLLKRKCIKHPAETDPYEIRMIWRRCKNDSGRNKEIQRGNNSVFERNAFGMQKSGRPSPPLFAVSNNSKDR